MNPVQLFLLSFFFLAQFGQAVNTIKKGQSIRDGASLISTNEVFQLGFFSPGSSNLRYVGIWYYKIEATAKSVVWVANRNNPISNGNGTLTIGNNGNLMILDGNNHEVWSSSNVSAPSNNNTVATLTDEGNLILSTSDDTTKAFWQSFEHPTDTYLPGMRVLVNSKFGDNHAFSSWKSASDPSIGNYTLGIDPHGSPQIVIWERLKRMWRSGQWNSVTFIGVPMISLTSFLYGFKLTSPDSDGNMYYTYVPANSSDLWRFRIYWDGHEEQLRWDNVHKNWTVMQRHPLNDCEVYNHCGNFGVCKSSESPKCTCMQGFVPKNEQQWNRGIWSGGCVRRTQLQCPRNSSVAGGEDGFQGFKRMKLPDFAEIAILVGSETCRDKCLQNCSCNAYAEITGIGCMIWGGDLIDLQQFDKIGNLLNIRLADSELDIDGKRKLSNAMIIIIVVVGAFVLCISAWLLWRFREKLKKALYKDSSSKSSVIPVPIFNVKRNEDISTDLSGSVEFLDGSQADGADLPIFSFSSIAIATNNFSEENMLGQGGFGPVYKGKLSGGQEVAIKRLSRISGQGLEEFKNEILLIAKLQHRNLVRLLGCCIEGEEKLLIYEYMPNKSLDLFIFDPDMQALLDWRKRFYIIEGIARGLIYLHRDSRLKIIHRDLKASNILLDEDMNPKISDFGMARNFGVTQDEANTMRIVGTYGYMSPEYAMEGLFSIKSDVYSFGVLLLEIVSGRRNISSRLSEQPNLIGYARQLWNEDRAMELVDPTIRDSCSEDQVLRCIQIGMLCVHESANRRPTMSSVALLLESETPTTIPLPRQPTFTSVRSSVDVESFLEIDNNACSNDLTVSMVSGR